ncbi:MAG TPA: methylated-DNA--[protein]-cysteine S-methyltransferase [Syntrophomonas sp.]|nr:methylated-DNA--[protein]-cysteine S-methyltransferase [Syntrophomonas sp.]
MLHLYTYKTILGPITIGEDDGFITYVGLPGDNPPSNQIWYENEVLTEAAFQLWEYLNGKRREFDLPLAPQGTEFQLQVWTTLQQVPYGETRSYKDIALKISNPGAYRAVGQANNRNPIPIFIPCHRVIGSNGKLIGYGGGLELKARLLDLEKCHYR